MILADKIIMLRKKNGWSQEELAEQMHVSRQSVSKWEGAQSVPDLNKILLLSQIFGVSTDYLLKDELEDAEPADTASAAEEKSESARFVSMEEAHQFLELKESTAGKFAVAVYLCITSPVVLILLAAAQETGRVAMTENMAAGVGMIVLFLVVAAAVALFITCGLKLEPYEYMEYVELETAYGVDGMAKERRKNFQSRFTASMVIGVCACILSVIPLFVTLTMTEDDWPMAIAVAALLLIIGFGVMILVNAGLKWEGTTMLLQEGDYTVEKKKNKKVKSSITGIYWLVVLAIFLFVGFRMDGWKLAGLIWPIAAVLYAALMMAVEAVKKEK